MKGDSSCDNGPSEYVSALFHVDLRFLGLK